MVKLSYVSPKWMLLNVQEEFKPAFYDKAYFEDGIKSNYRGYQNAEGIFVVLSRILAKTFRSRSILDIGCAYGHLIKHIRLGIRVGIDISTYAITKRRNTNKLLLASASHLPFKDNTFDTIVSFETLEHLTTSQIAQCLSEVNRVGKKWFCFTAPAPNTGEKEDLDGSHISLMYPEEWENLIKDQFFNWIPQPDLVKTMSRESLVRAYNWTVFVYDISNSNI